MPRSPREDLEAFHVVFGGTAQDVGLNAVPDLGRAEARVLAPVRPGAKLTATSDVIGLRQNPNGRTGVAWVRTAGRNQRGSKVLGFRRWVMVRERDAAAPAPSVATSIVGR